MDSKKIMNQLKEHYKIREVYEANRFERASRMLLKIEMMVYKSMGFDDKMIKTIKENYPKYPVDELKSIQEFDIEDRVEVEKCINKVNDILEKNGYNFHLMPKLELNSDAFHYPIDIGEVNEEYSFKNTGNDNGE